MTCDALLYTTVESPIGQLLLVGDGEALRGLYMQEGSRPRKVERGWHQASAPFDGVRAQLAEYFAGRRTTFDVPLAMHGTPFQRRVWQALLEVRYGQTRTYGEIARRIGYPSEARAVGAANGSNPIAVIVPCHRIIGSDGSLTGYGGGLQRKRLLLDLESERRAGRLFAA